MRAASVAIWAQDDSWDSLEGASAAPAERARPQPQLSSRCRCQGLAVADGSPVGRLGLPQRAASRSSVGGNDNQRDPGMRSDMCAGAAHARDRVLADAPAGHVVALLTRQGPESSLRTSSLLGCAPRSASGQEQSQGPGQDQQGPASWSSGGGIINSRDLGAALAKGPRSVLAPARWQGQGPEQEQQGQGPGQEQEGQSSGNGRVGGLPGPAEQHLGLLGQCPPEASSVAAEVGLPILP